MTPGLPTRVRKNLTFEKQPIDHHLRSFAKTH
jgi:hypothetical protein